MWLIFSSWCLAFCPFRKSCYILIKISTKHLEHNFSSSEILGCQRWQILFLGRSWVWVGISTIYRGLVTNGVYSLHSSLINPNRVKRGAILTPPEIFLTGRKYFLHAIILDQWYIFWMYVNKGVTVSQFFQMVIVKLSRAQTTWLMLLVLQVSGLDTVIVTSDMKLLTRTCGH